MRGCSRADMVWVCAGFDTRLIFMLVQSYGAYYLTKVEIVYLKRIKSKEEESEKGVERSSAHYWSTWALKDLLKNSTALKCWQRAHDMGNADLRSFRWFFIYLCYFWSLSSKDPYYNQILHIEEGSKVLKEDFLIGLREIEKEFYYKLQFVIFLYKKFSLCGFSPSSLGVFHIDFLVYLFLIAYFIAWLLMIIVSHTFA